MTEPAAAQITGVSPQFLVEDLERSIAYYRDQLGFTLDFIYEDFYASVSRGRCTIHLKHGPRLAAQIEFMKAQEHLDAYIAVSGVRELFGEIQGRGANIKQALEAHPWDCVDFIAVDPDGYILCFSELTTK